ncbi:MAG: DNA internalization-related competence protein ComEC/Rec2, partial [bacterium]|nr:DNA internalization-related competence protein ComEC/Rec2 [bacterium]
VKASCTLEKPEPFDGFAYDRFLARDGILAVCVTYKEPFQLGKTPVGILSHILTLKSSTIGRIQKIFHEPYAGLLEGLLLGEKSLPENSEEDFRRAGLSHIVAASGQNVNLVVMIMMSFLTKTFFRRKWASVIVICGIVVYVVLAGADAPVIRAGIMGTVIVFSKAIGRIPSNVNLLLLALALMLAHNPMLLRDDVGFQLSFAATAGLVVFEPRLARFVSFVPNWGEMRTALSSSLAAILATLPIMVLSFGEVSLVAPVANLLVLPLIPYVMGLGSVVVLISLVSLPLSYFLAAPAVGGLKLMFFAAHFLSTLPFASISLGNASWLRLLLFVLTLLLLKIVFSLKSWRLFETFNDYSWKSMVMIILVLCLPVLPDLIPNKNFRAFFFSVGQGDATWTEFPDGEKWLVDGGRDNTVLTKLGQVLPWYDHRVDVLVPTHADSDHITGLIEVSRRYDVGQVYLSRDESTLKMHLLKEELGDTPIEIVEVEQFLKEGDSRIQVIGPNTEGVMAKDRNESSLMLMVESEGVSLLLTGDAPQSQEIAALPYLGHVDIYKAGHHGSYTSTSQELLHRITPKIAIISSGLDNSYGHPHGIVLKRLRDIGAEILRTDLDGDVLVEVEGGELIVEVGALLF